MRQGEIWERGDRPTLALILSSNLYNEAGPGRVIVCPVIPGEPLPAEDFATDVPLATPLTGTVLPELVEWLPISGLTHPRGAVTAQDWQRIDQIVRAILGHI
ncbi:type II toxin-antitoxin system PemK/MazF family toxin [Catenulispora sp. NF23]|uniref:type II toxin-antitoxin system PemK/MazF family toxin n=1 Tax=Catenulispora pinistramenti TaxID=2705254 RepID=UPI001BA7D10D|nr:type II toxin-antitoxin system PemK/MazF family toxin [Catenulispora pinistramenti]MBS2531455.1 type II toxin-antitoxin system PemK/MazF family toxin [Catenulispora pinistramenti]